MSVAMSAVQQHEARQMRFRDQHGRRVGGGSAAAPSPLSFMTKQSDVTTPLDFFSLFLSELALTYIPGGVLLTGVACKR